MNRGDTEVKTHAMYALSLVSKDRLCFDIAERNASEGEKSRKVGSAMCQSASERSG